MVLLGSVPDPEDEAVLEFMNLDRSMKLAVIEITTSVLIKIVPLIEIVLIILMGRETGRSNLICNHLWSETGVSLVVIFCGGLRYILLDVVSINISACSGTILVRVSTTAVTQLGSTALTRARVKDETGAEDWFFLSKSNDLAKSLSSATSDEKTRVEKLVPTLATTALARD
nr:hypothetical protein [Tanacetum cinerariifolium]